MSSLLYLNVSLIKINKKVFVFYIKISIFFYTCHSKELKI